MEHEAASSEASEASEASGSTRALVVTIVVAAFVAPLALIGCVVASAYVRWLPVTASFALAMLGLVGLAAPTLRARLGRRGPLVAALALLGLAPFDWAFAATSLARPIVEVHWRCGTGDVMLMMILPFLVAGWSVASVLGGAIVAGRAVGVRMERALRTLARGVTGATLVAVAYGAVRARLPEPDRWLETRPIVATLAPDGWTARRVSAAASPDGTPTTTDQVALLGRVLHRRCVGPSCRLSWSDDAAAGGAGYSPQQATIEVRRDPTSGLVLFLEGGPQGGAVSAMDDQGARAVTVRDVASTLGPPRGWLVGAALGVAIAIALLVRGARFASLHARDLSQARLARVRDGELEFANGERWPAPRGLSARDHEVVTVLVDGAPPTDTFRHAEAPRFEALAGTPAELEADARATSAAGSAFALAAVFTLATPLATALVILAGAK